MKVKSQLIPRRTNVIPEHTAYECPECGWWYHDMLNHIDPIEGGKFYCCQCLTLRTIPVAVDSAGD